MRTLVGLLLVGALLGLQACARSGDQFNLIVITLDTLRADALGTYGNPYGHSPHIDAFAKDAVVFENAIAAIGTTFSSHSTIFTGKYPKNHGVMWNGDALDNRFTTLAEILSAAGYETAALVSLGSMLSRGGLQQGFSTVSDLVESEPALRDGVDVNEMAISWLDSREERPFFLWLHYFEPHAPYRLTQFARERMAGYQGPLAAGASVKAFYSLGHEIPWTPEEVRALRALYDGEVRETDRLIGEILDVLRRRELVSKTLVVIAADHGQALGEQGQIGHGFLLTQTVLHVPLMVRLPRVAPRRISNRVSLVDLTPFLIDSLGLPVPPDLDGQSLAGLLVGESQPSRLYFAEVRQIGSRLASIRKRLTDPKRRARALLAAVEQDPGAVAIFDGNVKGVWRNGEFRVYDLASDADELHPRIPEPGNAELTALREFAASYHQRGPIERSRTEFNEAARRELEALGYIR